MRLDPPTRRSRGAFLRASGSVRNAFAGVVQLSTATWPDPRLPRPLVPKGASDLARPDPRVESSVIGEQGHCGSEARYLGGVRLSVVAAARPLGRRRDVPRAPTSCASERRAHSPRAAEGLGRQSAGSVESFCEKLEAIQKACRQESFDCRPDRSSGCAAIEKVAKDAGHRLEGPRHAGAHGRVAEQPTSTPLPRSNRSLTRFRNYLRGKHSFC